MISATADAGDGKHYLLIGLEAADIARLVGSDDELIILELEHGLEKGWELVIAGPEAIEEFRARQVREGKPGWQVYARELEGEG